MRYYCKFLVIPCCFLLLSLPVDGQRRSRPGSLVNTDDYIENATKENPVTLKYIKSGASFYANVYYYSESGTARMKIGTATLTLKGSHYTLKFTAAQTEKRDVNSYDRKSNKQWRREKLGNDFVQEGRYETFKRNGKYFLRLFDGDSHNYIEEVSLKTPDQKDFTLEGEGLVFNFNLK